jgi:serine/threonine-protein kinase
MTGVDSERWRRLKPLLESLVELPAAEREARLAAVDPDLAAEARSMLAAADEEAPSRRYADAVAGVAASVLASLAEGPAAEGGEPAHRSPAAFAGMELGPWRLERPLGSGGMAEVWEARRADGQFEQTVAVKLLKRGMDSEEIERRFLQERQILARLEHPAIARLYDGGISADGRPYFVLERVDGRTITEWCAEHGAGVRERLRLLIACCEAVAAAHRQLVVHRDLKPSNILVTHDGQVKLLDFGIAKLLAADADPDLPEATRADVRVLTPSYAAPEQVLGEPVSTATDVYALGVVAYELLTGRLPHRRAGRRGAELAAAVASEVIARPSTAVREAADAEPGESAPEARDRRRWWRSLAGDLDTIVLTALRSDPARRYPSVAALAEDLGRYLAGRPIAARPDSLGYRAAKFAGRHRVSLAAAALALVSLVAGLVLALWQAERAARAAAEARAEATKSNAVVGFLTDVFTAADPEGRKAADLTARQLVDRGASQIDRQLAGQPETRAAMLHVLGGMEYRLGLYEPARKLLEEALALRRARADAAPADVAATEAALGALYHRVGESARGAALLESALAYHERAGAAANLDAASDLNNLANAYKALGRTDDARAAFARSIARLDADPQGDPRLEAKVLNNYGLLLTRTGDLAAARSALERALALHEQTSGRESALVSGTLGNLAELYIRLHETDRAVAASRRGLAISVATYGPAHYETGLSTNELGWTLLTAGRPAEARPIFEQAIAILRGAIGEHHRNIAYSYRNLGRALAETGQPRAAIAALRQAGSIWEETLPPGSLDLASVDELLGPLLVAAGEGEEGERRLARVVELRRAAGAASLGAAWLELARARVARCRLAPADEALAAARREAASHADADWAREIPQVERLAAAARCPPAAVAGARRGS